MHTLVKRISLICALILLFICAPLIEGKETIYAAKTSPDYVIVLDPGHDITHSGAHKNGYREEQLNLKIAQYCKAELERTPGIKVYMVRNSESCPYGGSGISSTTCNGKRVNFSKNVKADLYISFHLDSSGSSARGASVYYPNNNYKPEIGYKGEQLAKNILTQLKAIGISQRGRGIMIRNSENDTRYPDGSLADYLAVIKGNKQNDIPAVLIEHCFISSSADRNQFLSSEGKLHMLGKADSIGILNYLGLNNTFLAQGNDGQWYYHRDGAIDYNYTGLGANSSGWWYVKNGKVDFSANTIVKFKDSWWYVKNGKYDSDFTGIVRNQNGDWYVKNGEVDFSYNGLANVNNTYKYNHNDLKYDGWYNIKNGQVIYKDDVVAYNGKWWFADKGKVNFKANTIAPNSNGWWYIRNGQVDFGFNGIARNPYGDWFIKGGKVSFDKTGLVTVANSTQLINPQTNETVTFGGQYYVENGKVNNNATTLAYDGKVWWYLKDGKIYDNANDIIHYGSDWWYVKDGKVDFSFNGIARNAYGDWYLKNGKVMFDRTGLVQSIAKTQTYPDSNAQMITFDGWYNVVSGKVQYSQDIVCNSQGWWYVGDDGKVNFKFNGIAPNKYGTWYLDCGKVNFGYNNDRYLYNEKYYNIVGGKASEIEGVDMNAETINNSENITDETPAINELEMTNTTEPANDIDVLQTDDYINNEDNIDVQSEEDNEQYDSENEVE